jgi:O-acetyl-ADP-ribose deacetylase (regulator of RNase III)
MLHEVSGDLLLSRAAVIAHGVAPNDPFHSGLALALRTRFPSMYKDFRHYCQTYRPGPGSLWAWAGAGPEGPVRIVALFTQEGGYEHGAKPGRATLTNVSHALTALRHWLEKERPSSLALPRLATGVGGLEWKDVRPLLERHFHGLELPIEVVTTFRENQIPRAAALHGKA